MGEGPRVRGVRGMVEKGGGRGMVSGILSFSIIFGWLGCGWW